MGVIVEDLRIKHEFDSNVSDTNYLLGNVGDKVTIEVDFRVEEMFVTSATESVDRILLAPQPFRVNVADTTDVIYCELFGAFANFREGDNIRWWNGTSFSGERTIYEKISDEAIRVHPVGGVAGDDDFRGTPPNEYDVTLATNSYIFISTEFTAVNYRWNFIGNFDSEDMINRIDDQMNQARAGGLTALATPVSMTFDAPVTNNYGTISVERTSDTDTAQKFTLTHETIITPFFLSDQINDIKNGIAPDYFAADNALKYITSIDVGRHENDPNFIQTVKFTALDGNTGWFGENFNGGNSKYYIDGVTYKRQDLSTIDSVELTANEQTVEIVVKSLDSTITNLTEFALNFCILPDEDSDYQNNGRTVVQNFYFDRAKGKADLVVVNGDNETTTEQVFIEVSADDTAADTLTITAKIQFASEVVADLLGRADINYMMWVSTQDQTKDSEDADRVSLIADIETFYIDTSDDGMIVYDEVKFLRHYESDFDTEGTTTPIVRTQDDVLPYIKFHIDRLTRETDDIEILSITSSLIAKKLDGTEFTLEEFSQSFSGLQVIGDAQYIDITSERSFQMPDGDQRKTISVKRRLDLDTATDRFYEVKYPFIMRWEDFKPKSGVDGDAFDISEPNNGQNEKWVRYDTLTDWDIYFKVNTIASKNGNLQSYPAEVQLETYDFLVDTDWINETIELFDAVTGDPLNGLIKSPCKVVVTKEYAGATVPASADNVEWVVRIGITDQSDVSDIRFLSSVYDWTENSWLKSVDGSNLVKKTKLGNVFTAEVLIDFDKLPDASQFDISARVYDENALLPIPPNAKLMEDGTPKLTESGSYKLIE